MVITNEKRTQSITPAQDGFLAFSANFQSSSRVDWNTAQVVQGSYTAETMPEYAPYFNGGTATTEMLLKVGDYQDVQSILDGVVTRNVGVKVFDGTEGFTELSTPHCFRFGFVPRGIGGVNPICSHYPAATITLSVANMPDQTIKGHATAANNFYFKDSRFTTGAELQAWLAAQYAAGTPVIVVYALETPTTESVTGQTLQVTDGDNTVEITQASMDGLELEAQYNTLVQLTVQEVESANLDNDVTVTIL